MTVKDLSEAAGGVLEGSTANAIKLARCVRELLGCAWPCGMEEPPIVSMGDGTCGVLVENGSDPLTPDELRGYAVRLLQLADETEEQNG